MKYLFPDEMPERDLIGRIIRVEQLGDGSYGRTSVEVDSVDVRRGSDVIAAQIDHGTDTGEFAALRIVTTLRRFYEVCGVFPEEGVWLRLRVGPKDGVPRPIVFHSQLREAGYTEQSRGSLFECSGLFSDKETEPSPTPLGASVSHYVSLARAIEAASSFPDSAIASRRAVVDLFSQFAPIDHVLVRDVGQANFLTLVSSQGQAVAHFDVGWPLSFNWKSAPSFCSVTADAAPVILSHWDFDHLHGFYRFPHLQTSIWLAPVQRLGPGQARISRRLAAENKLLGWSGGSIKVNGLALLDCNGPNNSNDSGNALLITLKNRRRVLCMGDAAYSAIERGALGGPVDNLVVTHHGARFEGVVPAPLTSGQMAVVSVGRGNVYNHPRPEAVSDHQQNGWNVVLTSGLNGYVRMDQPVGK